MKEYTISQKFTALMIIIQIMLLESKCNSRADFSWCWTFAPIYILIISIILFIVQDIRRR